ncbi:MAG: phenylalanine--tRNA ligase subunit alpha [Patescibacteria group bacterium]
MLNKLKIIEKEAVEKIKKARSLSELSEVRVEYIGRKGGLTEILRGLSGLPVRERPKVGSESNRVKNLIEAAWEARKKYLEKKQADVQLEEDIFDVSLPAQAADLGHIHPITRVIMELEDYFGRMGYMIYETPNLTNEYDNFVAVNIPADHPARGMWDTFWVEGKEKGKGNLCLPPHTSCIQHRILKENKPPYKAVAIGRCFRYEATDAKHEHTIHQIEGVIVDKNLSVGHLKKTLMDMVQFIIGRRVDIRLRPSYFPFVEPGFEVDAQCVKCGGVGARSSVPGRVCNICKGTGWIELLGAGMIHQNVFVEAGYKYGEWRGFAFGAGIDRLAMFRYGIEDIRGFFRSDKSFIEQF